jgi:imidazolonepropionase-like amidohydrolase
MPRRTFAPSRCALAAAVLAPAALSAQLGSYNPPPGPQATIAIRGARIVTVSGPELASGTVVVSGGKITAVGADAAVPAGATVIDGAGLTVYPGMMDAGTSLGLSEIGQGAAATVDVSEVGTFNPNAQAFYGVNPQSAHIGVTRVVGVTHVLTRPSGGVVSGQAALLNLAGSTVPEMNVVPRAAMVIELPRSGFGGGRFGGGFAFAAAANPQEVSRTRTRQLDSLRALLRDAEAYARVQEAYAKDRSLPRPRQDVVLASLVPTARRQMPVLFIADRAADIREAVAFAEEMKLQPIIVGGRDAWQVAAFLKQKDVPVLLSAVMDLPSREDDPYDVNFSAPAKLAAAGVRFAVTSGDQGAETRNLPYTAGMAAAFGLSKADALKSVTLWPAQILGVGDRLGSIEVGKMANLVVTDGDLLEARTQTKHLIIDGRVVPLESKHTDLNERFKDRP